MLRRRSCPVPASPSSPPARLARTPMAPLWRYLSAKPASHTGPGGNLLARIWINETAAVNDTAIDLLAPVAGQHILELGFGPGRTLGRIAATGASVVGVETSAAMLHTATRRNRRLIRAGRMSLHNGDGATIPIDTHSIDGAISVHTIYFWPRPDQTIAEFARVLRPGGRLVLAFRAGQHRLPRRLHPDIYRTVPTTDQAVAWLRAAGFTDIQVETQPQTAPTIAWLSATTELVRRLHPPPNVHGVDPEHVQAAVVAAKNAYNTSNRPAEPAT